MNPAPTTTHQDDPDQNPAPPPLPTKCQNCGVEVKPGLGMYVAHGETDNPKAGPLRFVYRLCGLECFARFGFDSVVRSRNEMKETLARIHGIGTLPNRPEGL